MFQVSIREENGATVVSDAGSIATLLNVGDRPLERIIWGSDHKQLGEAVADLKTIYSAVLLQVAEKRGEVTKVGLSPSVPTEIVAAFKKDASAPLRNAAGTPSQNGNGHKSGHSIVRPTLEELIANPRIMWRLRKGKITTVERARDLLEGRISETELPSRSMGPAVRHAVAKALKKLDRS